MDAKKINQYAYNIISLTWPKYKKHMGDRDLENIKIVEDMLLKFKNEITTEFIVANTSVPQHVHPKTKIDSEKYETLTIVTFKSNFRSGMVTPFQTWRRNTERRITNFTLRNDPTKDIDDWSEELHTAHTVLAESDKDVITEGIRKYFPEAEIVNIEQIFKDKLDLVLFANFKGIVNL